MSEPEKTKWEEVQEINELVFKELILSLKGEIPKEKYDRLVYIFSLHIGETIK